MVRYNMALGMGDIERGRVRARVTQLACLTTTLNDVRDVVDRYAQVIRPLPGFHSCVMLASTVTQEAFVVCTWADSATLLRAPDIRNHLLDSGCTIRNDDTMDVIAHVPGSGGTSARLTLITLQPQSIPARIAMLESEVLPELRLQQGFGGALFLVNRGTGRGVAYSIWQTRDDFESSRPRAVQRFSNISQRFAALVIVETLDVALAHHVG
jgi:hypothetical protein